MKPGIHPVRWLIILVLVSPVLWAALALGSEFAWVVVTEMGGGFGDPTVGELLLGLAALALFTVLGGASIAFPIATAALWVRRWPSEFRRSLFLVSFWIIWLPSVLAIALFMHPVVAVVAIPSVGAAFLLKLEDVHAPPPVPRLEDLA